jgi:hypothetical protein
MQIKIREKHGEKPPVWDKIGARTARSGAEQKTCAHRFLDRGTSGKTPFWSNF